MADIIGVTIMARIIPAVTSPSPCPTLPFRKLKPKKDGAALAIKGKTSRDSVGPKVITPQSPYTTLGIPVRISRKKPTPLESPLGSFLTTAKAAPIETGIAISSAIADDSSVPANSGQMPKVEPTGWSIPSVFIGSE